MLIKLQFRNAQRAQRGGREKGVHTFILSACPVPGFTLGLPGSLQLSPLMCKLKNADKIVNVFNLRAQKASATATAKVGARATPTAREQTMQKAQQLPLAATTKGSNNNGRKLQKQKAMKIEQEKQIKIRIESRIERLQSMPHCGSHSLIGHTVFHAFFWATLKVSYSLRRRSRGRSCRAACEERIENVTRNVARKPDLGGARAQCELATNQSRLPLSRSYSLSPSLSAWLFLSL